MKAKKRMDAKLKKALFGIEQAVDSEHMPIPSQAVLSRLREPPTYIVRMLLLNFLGFDWSTEDKMDWVVNVKFQGIEFTLHDWRRSRWAIRSTSEGDSVREAAQQLHRKFCAAGTILNSLLQPALKGRVDNGFHLPNSFHAIRRQYEYFRQSLEEEMVALNENSDVPSDIGDTHWFDALIGPRIRSEQIISHNSCAMVSFFFSYTEFLFDILYAFKAGREQSYVEFRKQTWADRFKTVLPVSTDGQLRPVYEKLLDVKRNIRDVVLHGFPDETALLVPLGYLGLIPVSYKTLTDSVIFSANPVGSSDAQQILKVCQEFDDWVLSNDAAWFAYRYAETGFEIPFEPDAVDRITGWMSTRQGFEEALQMEAGMRDYMDEKF